MVEWPFRRRRDPVIDHARGRDGAGARQGRRIEGRELEGEEREGRGRGSGGRLSWVREED